MGRLPELFGELAPPVGFQFIGFPNEWGAVIHHMADLYVVNNYVSNLLGSPTSGERVALARLAAKVGPVSNLLGSPTSGE